MSTNNSVFFRSFDELVVYATVLCGFLVVVSLLIGTIRCVTMNMISGTMFSLSCYLNTFYRMDRVMSVDYRCLLQSSDKSSSNV